MDMKITGSKGINLDMPNRITLSVQIGGGNYCDNYDFPIGNEGSRTNPLPASRTAELACWRRDEEWFNLGDDVVSNRTPIANIFGMIPHLMALPRDAPRDDVEAVLHKHIYSPS